jgi:hypothetical protein
VLIDLLQILRQSPNKESPFLEGLGELREGLLVEGAELRQQEDLFIDSLRGGSQHVIVLGEDLLLSSRTKLYLIHLQPPRNEAHSARSSCTTASCTSA